MKDHPSDLVEPSRRGFAKSAAVALVAAPLAAALAACRKQTPNQQNAASSATPQTTPEPPYQKVPCEPTGNPITHEPPIIIGSGSLHLDLYRNIKYNGVVSGQPRPYRYVLESGAYKSIGIVKVTTEDSGGQIYFDRYLFTESVGCRLLIWLEQLKKPNPQTVQEETDYDDSTQQGSSPAHLLLKGDPFEIEAEQQLQARTASYKSHRPHRWTHPGYGNKHFRIGRWELQNAAGVRLYGDDSDDDYTFAVSLYD